MDILRKMFSNTEKNAEKKDDKCKDDLKSSSWFEDHHETPEDMFGNNKRKFMFQFFTDPIELQKHFDQQMKELLEEFENGEDFNNDEYLQPGFKEKIMKDFRENIDDMDSDLDDKAFKDQLHSILQALSPESNMKPPLSEPLNSKKKKFQQKLSKKPLQTPKLTDEETIMRIIHGTLDDENKKNNKPVDKRRDITIHRKAPQFGGVFKSPNDQKFFGQSVVTQIVRKPDGSYETKKITRDSNGNVKTTITRTIDGKTETITFDDDKIEKYSKNQFLNDNITVKGNSSLAALKTTCGDRNIYVSENGYALPVNMW